MRLNSDACRLNANNQNKISFPVNGKPAERALPACDLVSE